MDLVIIQSRVERAVLQYKAAPEVDGATRADGCCHRRTRHGKDVVDNCESFRAPLARPAEVGRVDTKEELGRGVVIPQITDQVDIVLRPFVSMTVPVGAPTGLAPVRLRVVRAKGQDSKVVLHLDHALEVALRAPGLLRAH